MDGLKVIVQQDTTLTLDEFYGEATAAINEAQREFIPVLGRCDWLRDPLAHGIQIFPVRTYEILQGLNKSASEPKAIITEH